MASRGLLPAEIEYLRQWPVKTERNHTELALDDNINIWTMRARGYLTYRYGLPHVGYVWTRTEKPLPKTKQRRVGIWPAAQYAHKDRMLRSPIAKHFKWASKLTNGQDEHESAWWHSFCNRLPETRARLEGVVKTACWTPFPEQFASLDGLRAVCAALQVRWDPVHDRFDWCRDPDKARDLVLELRAPVLQLFTTGRLSLSFADVLREGARTQPIPYWLNTAKDAMSIACISGIALHHGYLARVKNNVLVAEPITEEQQRSAPEQRNAEIFGQWKQCVSDF